jgi:hypothetical protein
MYTVVKFSGIVEQILQEAVDEGLAKTKTEALRLAILGLNDKYNLLNKIHKDEFAVRKMQKIDEEINSRKRKVLSEEQALRKYG